MSINITNVIKTSNKTYIIGVNAQYALATNGQYLLTNENDKVCLYDKDNLGTVTTLTWINGNIMDMCWCSTLNAYLLITHSKAYVLNMIDNKLNKIESINRSNNTINYIYRCVCTEKTFFVTYYKYGTPIDEYDLTSSSFSLIKQWKTPETCKEDDIILDILYNSHTNRLGILIGAQQSCRLDIRNLTMIAIWSVDLFQIKSNFYCRLSLLPANEWLIIDPQSSSFFQITADGKLNAHVRDKREPRNATMFGSNLFAIITNDGLSVHDV